MASEHKMISPFEDKQIREKKISYGLSSFGYDARVSDEFKIFTMLIQRLLILKILRLAILLQKTFLNVLFHLIRLY